MGLTAVEAREALELDAALTLKKRQRAIDFLFSDNGCTGPNGGHMHGREGYKKHLEFFKAGAEFRERCFMAANRVGKTVGGGYETALHLTGEYPDWWEGRRFERPTECWAAGKTNETTRDIVQKALLGPIKHEGQRKTFEGTGLVKKAALGGVTWKQGVTDLADTIKVKHASGGWSQLGIKSYQQGRGSFEGTEKHVIWLDEECPMDIYGECLIRTATTGGITMLTFTPLEGLTQTVLQFLPHMDPSNISKSLS